jgi:hypothetical protein
MILEAEVEGREVLVGPVVDALGLEGDLLAAVNLEFLTV